MALLRTLRSGGGSNTSEWQNRLYAPGFPYQSGPIFNGSNGKVESALASDTVIPSFTSTGVEVINESGTLTGENPSTRTVKWTLASLSARVIDPPAVPE